MIKKIFLILASICLLLINSKISFAEGMDYSIRADIPCNQIDKNLNYFDLMMKPGEDQDISITLTNQSEETEIFKISVNNALTTKNGNIDYTNHNVDPDESLKYPLEKLVTNNYQVVEIKSGETTKVPFHISMPKEKIEGVILGGIHISKEQTEANQKIETIKNKYSHVIGLQIRQSLNAVTPIINLNEIQTTLVNNYIKVVANLQNSTASIISKVSIDTQIMEKNNNNLLLRTKKENMSIAPNTNFDFLVDGENTTLSSGVYTLNIHISSEQGDWYFTKNFSLNNKQVTQNTTKADNYKSMYNILAIIVIAILGISFIYFILKKSSSNEA